MTDAVVSNEADDPRLCIFAYYEVQFPGVQRYSENSQPLPQSHFLSASREKFEPNLDRKNH